MCSATLRAATRSPLDPVYRPRTSAVPRRGRAAALGGDRRRRSPSPGRRTGTPRPRRRSSSAAAPRRSPPRGPSVSTTSSHSRAGRPVRRPDLDRHGVGVPDHPALGVHRQPGGNDATFGRSATSNARSSLANRVAPCSPSIQYSGLTPIGSRATRPAPPRVAIAMANIPFRWRTAAGPSRMHRVQRGLGVRPGLRDAVGQRGGQPFVVVDLTVADDPRALAEVGERLVPAAHVDDRQALVAEPRPLQRQDPGVVGTSVLQPGQHPLTLLRVDLPEGGDDSAHVLPHNPSSRRLAARLQHDICDGSGRRDGGRRPAARSAHRLEAGD